MELLLLFWTLSTSILRGLHAQGGSIYQRAPDFAKSIHKAEVIKIGKLEYRQPTGVPKPGLVKSFWEDLLKTCKSFCTDNSLSQDVPFQFGLHIHATPGVMITSANKKPVKKSGCSGDRCTCNFDVDAKKNTYSFTMKGEQKDAFSTSFKFTCKEVIFTLKSTGQTCTCDFRIEVTVTMDGYSSRKLINECLPQYCLKELFSMHGGGGEPGTTKQVQDQAAKLTGPYVEPKTGISYWAQCDANPFCQTWDNFKTSFQAEWKTWKNRFGKQGGEKLAGIITLGGRKFFYGFVINPREQRGNTLVGFWTPAVSGGQASFSASMHWEKSEEKSRSEEVASSLSASLEYSYMGVEGGMEYTKSWASSASKTNSDTHGGEKSQTCAAYQCEGGTTWQWQMQLGTAKFNTKFDNCIFVCTPDQGVTPKCPFGACCSADDRQNECATCSVLWCDPAARDCPLNEFHPEYAKYCGERDALYVSFLKKLRSRVATWYRVTEQQDFAFEKMKQKYAIEKNGLDLLQDAYDRLSHLKKEQSSNPEIEKLSTQMKNKLNNMTVNVVKHEFNEVERYLQVAQDQASAFHYESAMHQLDPCAPVKGSQPKPGDPQWCLCGSNGLRIRWEEGDDSAVQAILDAPSKDTNPEQLNALLSLPSSCREGNRKSLCHWKGNITDGSCCSKAGGCYKGPMRKPDRKEFAIPEIDLVPEDFKIEELLRANTRFRLQCFYEVDPREEVATPISPGTNLLRFQESNQKNKHRKKAKAATSDTADNGSDVSPQEVQRVIHTERDNLFLCFRKFFRDNVKEMFTLQKIDEMLVEETASCEDRIVNPKCMKKIAPVVKEDLLSLGGGGGGASSDDSGDTEGSSFESGGGDGGGGGGGDGDKEDDGDKKKKKKKKVCCELEKDKKASSMTAKKCTKANGSIVSGKRCKGEDTKGTSLTADADNVQRNEVPAKNAQDGKSFEKEQKDVQDKRSGKNGRRNKCCQKGDVYVPMEKCKKGYKEIRDMKKCESRQK